MDLYNELTRTDVEAHTSIYL